MIRKISALLAALVVAISLLTITSPAEARVRPKTGCAQGFVSDYARKSDHSIGSDEWVFRVMHTYNYCRGKKGREWVVPVSSIYSYDREGRHMSCTKGNHLKWVAFDSLFFDASGAEVDPDGIHVGCSTNTKGTTPPISHPARRIYFVPSGGIIRAPQWRTGFHVEKDNGIFEVGGWMHGKFKRLRLPG